MNYCKAIQGIIDERNRQIDVEGWTPEHDDTHTNGELAKAAACYAGFADGKEIRDDTVMQQALAKLWPWFAKWWKPTTRRRNLVKAGALIVAEIQRLDRTEASTTKQPKRR